MAEKETKKMGGDWLEALRAPHINMIKKYVWEMLKDRYMPHDDFLDRIAGSVNSRKDMEAMTNLFAELYSAGYTKCVQDHADKMKEHGLRVNIVPDKRPKVDAPPIFQEKSG